MKNSKGNFTCDERRFLLSAGEQFPPTQIPTQEHQRWRHQWRDKSGYIRWAPKFERSASWAASWSSLETARSIEHDVTLSGCPARSLTRHHSSSITTHLGLQRQVSHALHWCMHFDNSFTEDCISIRCRCIGSANVRISYYLLSSSNSEQILLKLRNLASLYSVAIDTRLRWKQKTT